MRVVVDVVRQVHSTRRAHAIARDAQPVTESSFYFRARARKGENREARV
jgi:hypothetical protein